MYHCNLLILAFLSQISDFPTVLSEILDFSNAASAGAWGGPGAGKRAGKAPDQHHHLMTPSKNHLARAGTPLVYVLGFYTRATEKIPKSRKAGWQGREGRREAEGERNYLLHFLFCLEEVVFCFPRAYSCLLCWLLAHGSSYYIRSFVLKWDLTP